MGGEKPSSALPARGSNMPKTLEENFTDWENDAFGFGYGTGEERIIPALKTFFTECKGESGNYEYQMLEAALTPTVAWLLINLMCHQGIIEYGTSPRYGWLRSEGIALKTFIDGKSVDELYALTVRNDDYNTCYRNSCNCGPDDYQHGVKCTNPFWGNP